MSEASCRIPQRTGEGMIERLKKELERLEAEYDALLFFAYTKQMERSNLTYISGGDPTGVEEKYQRAIRKKKEYDNDMNDILDSMQKLKLKIQGELVNY